MLPLEIQGLSKIYKRKITQKVTALNNLNLSINSGEIFGFLGPNGAGKSTTIKLILDIIKPSNGTISIFGLPAKNPKSRESIGYLPENPVFYDYLTAKELMLYTAQNHNITVDSQLNKRIDDILERLELSHVRDTRLRRYSKGMVQRAGIAQAIIAAPDLLILDEPASGLDPVGRKLVTDILLELKNSGKTIFFSSHILHDVETICDRIGILIKGELKFTGSISEVTSSSYSEYEIICQEIDEKILKEKIGEKLSYHKEGDSLKITVNVNDVWELTDSLRVMNGRLVSIQPKRKSLEDIFLDYLKQ